MFEDSLFASGGIANPRRGWTALVSFFAQTCLIAVLIALPLMFTEAVPLTHWTDYWTVPPAAAPPVVQEVVRHPAGPTDSNMFGDRIVQPPRIPTQIHQVVDEGPAPSDIGETLGVIGSPNLGSGTNDDFMHRLLASASRASDVHPALSKPLVISRGVSEGLLIRQVKPVYPAIAITARIQGEVILQAVIGKDGTIQNLRVISGPPLLITSAVDAVQQWRYRPYLLNGEPVEVETQIRVNFSIS